MCTLELFCCGLLYCVIHHPEGSCKKQNEQETLSSCTCVIYVTAMDVFWEVWLKMCNCSNELCMKYNCNSLRI